MSKKELTMTIIAGAVAGLLVGHWGYLLAGFFMLIGII